MHGPENTAGSADAIEPPAPGTRGDRAAFIELAHRHRTRLLGLCRLITCDDEAARAAATNALRDVWKRFADGAAAPSSARALFDRCAVTHSLALVPYPSAPETGADSGAGTFEPALRRLTPRQRAVLALSDFAGLGHDEIADTMDEPPDRIRREIGKARRDLLRWTPTVR